MENNLYRIETTATIEKPNMNGAAMLYCDDGIAFVKLHPVRIKEKLKEAQTNADRIRAMSDNELAEFICGVFDDDDDIGGKFINGCFIPCYDQYSIKEWLQQPADEVK